jgi:hypothetical protein
MAKVIIGIHGLSNKPAKNVLENWWTLSMKEGLKAIGKQQDIPKFEMAYWADLFYKNPLDENIGDNRDPRFLDEPYRVSPRSLVSKVSSTRLKVMDFLGEKINDLFLNPDFSLKYTYITDIIVDKYFHELGDYFKSAERGNEKYGNDVRSTIAKRVIETLNKYEGYDIFLVCHSMGSIIAFDILSFEAPNAKIKTLATIGSPLGMPNVKSQIASLQRKHGFSSVTMKTPPSVVKSWVNFSDAEDPVAFNYRLSDDFSENELGVKPLDFLVFNNYINNGERNPHKSFGYLRTPEFANALAEFIESKQSVSHMIKNMLKRIAHLLKKLLNYLKLINLPKK